MTEFSRFDATDYLDNEETIAEYLTAALEDTNPDVFLAAIADVAKVRGMSQLAKNAGLGRESLYKATGTRCKTTLRHGVKGIAWFGGEVGGDTIKSPVAYPYHFINPPPRASYG